MTEISEYSQSLPKIVKSEQKLFISPACAKRTVEDWARMIEHCSGIIEHCSSITERCSSIIEHRSSILEHCSKIAAFAFLFLRAVSEDLVLMAGFLSILRGNDPSSDSFQSSTPVFVWVWSFSSARDLKPSYVKQPFANFLWPQHVSRRMAHHFASFRRLKVWRSVPR